MKTGKWILCAAIASSALLAAGAASAKVTVLGTSPNNGSGPYSNHFVVAAPTTETDYASFQITSNQLVYGTFGSVLNGGDRAALGDQLEIFSGGSCTATACTGGSSVSTGTSATTPTVLSPGFYYEQITVDVGPGKTDYFGAIFGQGGLGSGVPEPASWAMVILGFGLLGSGLRVQRRRAMLPA